MAMEYDAYGDVSPDIFVGTNPATDPASSVPSAINCSPGSDPPEYAVVVAVLTLRRQSTATTTTAMITKRGTTTAIAIVVALSSVSVVTK